MGCLAHPQDLFLHFGQSFEPDLDRQVSSRHHHSACVALNTFYGRVSTEDQQDPASSRAWQLERSRQLIEPHGGVIVEHFFDIGHSRSLPWKRRPEATRLLQAFRDPDRGFAAVVIGEPQRAFYGSQFGLTFPVFEHYDVRLWVPEVGGAVDPGSEAHDLVMNLFGGMSKGERMRIKTRVRAAMSSQTAAEGRFLGGRPPYGYRLVPIGPHPHPEKAAAGIQLKALDPDPVTAPVVQRIYRDFLAGMGYFAIAEELSADAIPSPSAHDRRRNPHRPGRTWAKSAVRTILLNPRYTGYQVWGKQRRDEVLLDVEDVAAGHETRMRWNADDKWVWSQEPAHEPIVTRDDFEAVQAIIASRTRPTGPRRRTGNPNVYLLRGRLHCNLCSRLMQGQQNHGEPYYRCKYSDEYARSAELDHPRNVYLREASVIDAIDEWLAELFTPDRLDRTLDLIIRAGEDVTLTPRIEADERTITEAKRKLSRYRALLDGGTDPAIVAEWIAETTAERSLAERELAQLRAGAKTLERGQLIEVLEELGGMVPLLRAADPTKRARFYEAVRLTGTYDPGANRLHLSTNPGGDMVRVGGGNATLNPRRRSHWLDLASAA